MPSTHYVAWKYLCPISIFCSFLLMCATSITIRNERSESKKRQVLNIFWMAFSDCGFAINYWMRFFYPSIDETPIYCTIRGVLNQFFMESTTGWYFIITLNIFLSIQKSSYQKWLKTRYVSHIYVWVFALLTSLIPIRHYVHLSDDTIGLCMVDKHVWYLRWVEFAGIFVTFFFTIGVLILIISILRPKIDNEMRKTILLRTIVFVFVFIATWLPPAVAYTLLQPFFDCASVCNELVVLMVSLNGTLNFIVWFLCFPNLRKSFRRICPSSKFLRKDIRKPLLYTKEKSTEEISGWTKTIVLTTSEVSIN